MQYKSTFDHHDFKKLTISHDENRFKEENDADNAWELLFPSQDEEWRILKKLSRGALSGVKGIPPLVRRSSHWARSHLKNLWSLFTLNYLKYRLSIIEPNYYLASYWGERNKEATTEEIKNSSFISAKYRAECAVKTSTCIHIWMYYT